jgi:hypothetical protein
MLTLIYPYRNRDLQRIQRSLNSLTQQTVQDFKVRFVDYGSDPLHAERVKALVESYQFTTYSYHFTQYQPWNKSRALNSIIKTLYDGYCFVADVDMIFAEDFIETALSLQKPEHATYFKVGFLDNAETKQDKAFEAYTIKFESTHEATGLTMCPVKLLYAINGFDEFYHFWGSEDTDLHVRLKNAGYQVNFYENKILMLHQWHKTYRLKETNSLSEDLQLSNIVRYNYKRLMEAISQKKTIVNDNTWGQPLNEQDFSSLSESTTHKQLIFNYVDHIDYYVFQELPNLSKGIHHVTFKSKKENTSLKYKLKKILGKRVDSYYTMKTVNDILLLHIISFYRNYPYFYRVNEDTKEIQFSIKID